MRIENTEDAVTVVFETDVERNAVRGLIKNRETAQLHCELRERSSYGRDGSLTESTLLVVRAKEQ